MSLNGTYLANARDLLAARKAENDALRARREQVAYDHIPELRDIDNTLRAQMLELVTITLHHGDNTAALKALEQANLDTQAKRAELLASAGYPIDYTDPVYTCPVCHDNGYLPNGGICDCLMKLYNAEATKAAATLLRAEVKGFDDFKLSYYDADARQQMARTLELCRAYAESFAPGAPNLLLQGGTGLGKTFLSACIARTVAAQGFSVAYESAAAALGAFETAKFQRFSDTGAEAQAKTDLYLSCDLMILDDLGTEMISPYSVSALYTLINTRLTRGKSTIISTNCTDADLQRSYSPQILSRIEGEYQALPFVGRDIRQVKKELGIG